MTDPIVATLQKSRSGLMGVIRKYNNSIKDWLKSTSVPELQGQVSAVELTRDKFRITTSQLLEHIDDAKIEDYFTENSEKEIDCEVILESLKARLTILNPPAAVPSTSTGSSQISQTNQVNQNHVQLERLKSETYDGNPLTYQVFWDRYNSRYHKNNSINEVDKFEYLLQILTGPALSAVKGLPPTQANYQQAINIIQQRFGKKTPRINAHVMAILDLPKGGKSMSVDDLRHMTDVIVQNIRGLRAMGVLSNSSAEVSAVLGPILFTRMPDKMCQRWWESHADEDGIVVDSLIKFIEKYVESLELSKASRGELSANPSKESRRNPRDRENRDLYSSTLHSSTTESSKGSKSKRNRGHRDKDNTTHPSGNVGGFSLSIGSYPSNAQPQGNGKPPCPFCQSDHYPGKCDTAKRLPSSEVIQKLRSSNRCLCCFNFSHQTEDCKFRPNCSICKGNHMKLICPLRVQDSIPNQQGRTEQRSVSFVVDGSSNVLLQIAKVKAIGRSSSKVARCLLDGGSESSFISHDLARELRLKVVARPSLSIETFGGSNSTPTPTNVYQTRLQSLQNPAIQFDMNLVGTTTIANKQHPTLSSLNLDSYSHLHNLSFSDSLAEGNPKVQILIGADYYFQLVDGKLIKGAPDQPSAISTAFGWVLSGPSPSCNGPIQLPRSVNFIQASLTTDQMLSDFFSLESYGMEPDEPFSVQNTSILDSFCQSVEYTGNRYRVCLPWKDRHSPLLPNEAQAIRRLKSLNKRLDNDPELKESYSKALEEFKELNFIEPAPAETLNPVYYIPHHPVVKKTSKTTKVRPVFDASCKGPNGISLNDCLEVGPSLNPDIIDLLLRFRMSPIGICSDIKKAFPQVELKEERDKDVCRFIWYDEAGNQTIFRFRVVTFGIVSSPFLLGATIRYHLQQQPQNKIIQEMLENFYVDNLLQGASNTNEAILKVETAHEVMKSAGMELCQWSTNSSQLITHLEQQLYDRDQDKIVKVLGLNWDTSTDQLLVKTPPINEDSSTSNATKRTLLSHLAKIFDPLGFHAVVVVRGKILLQKLWLSQESWDDPITDSELLTEFKLFVQEASQLESYPIPRHPFQSSGAFQTLHIFCDSSKVASVACAYLREQTPHSITSNLLISKTRVVPLKFPEGRQEDLRIPRKELVSCLMGAKLGTRVASVLKLDSSLLYFWSDSEISLGWIKNLESLSPPVFVKNRAFNIQQLSSPDRWFHVRSADNPADIPSRGTKRIKDAAQSSLWNHGPSWLSEKEDQWPEQRFTSIVSCPAMTIPEDKQPSPLPLIQLDRFSSLNKAIRTTAFVIKYIRLLRGRVASRKQDQSSKIALLRSIKPNIQLDHNEVEEGLMFLIHQEQKRAFEPEFRALSSLQPLPKTSSLLPLRPTWDPVSKILVSIGRERPLSPLIIVPKQSHLSYLIMLSSHHSTYHGGAESTLTKSRERFWTINGRVVAKRVIKECTRCKVFNAVPYSQKESSLPNLRVTKTSAFQVCGCDYCGPFHVRDGTKCYILLFTCAVTRGVHLELVHNLSTATFLDAFRRFQARRCSPKTMYSDNALTFRLAAACLKSSIDWRFIPDKSPWWGGFYERLMKSIKNPLRRTLGKSLISFQQFETLIIEIEAVLNSRPLTIVTDDPSAELPLTPNHFLKTDLTPNLIPVEDATPTNSLKSWRHRQRLLNHFWHRWETEYLSQLRQWRQKKSVGSVLPSVGDLVLMEVDRKNRIHWPLARIVSLINGVDDFPRAAFIKVVSSHSKDGNRTQTTVLRRPTKLLYPLETVGQDDHKLPKPTDPVPPETDEDPLPPPSPIAQVPVRSTEIDGSKKRPNSIDDSTNANENDRKNNHHQRIVTNDQPAKTRLGRTVKKPSYLKDYE